MVYRVKLEWMAGPFAAESAMLTAGLNVYWPFWLVCIGGVILVVIAILALLLLMGHTDYPTNRKEKRPLMPIKRADPVVKAPAEPPATLTFIRIGFYTRETSTSIAPNQWLTVGKAADFCLDDQDQNLADVHFRIRLTGETLWVEAVEKETFVNGVPTGNLGTVSMESGDLLRAGSYEYRVILSPGKGSVHVT